MKNQDNSINGLNDKQLLAIDFLLDGFRQVEVAREIDVAEETISRWRNGDAAFIACFNRRRLELWEESRQQILAARHQAIDVLVDLLSARQPDIRHKAASTLLSKLDGGYPGTLETNPEQIQLEIEARNQTGMDRKMAELMS